MEDNYGNPNSDPTHPDTPESILANATLRFAESARHIGVAVPLLFRLTGDERSYFAGRLAGDIREFSLNVDGFATLVAFIAGES